MLIGHLDGESRFLNPSRYLDTMYGWADALDIEPDDLECRVFSAEADAAGNQWAKPKRPADT
jgi:hypothetical protein